MNESITRRSLAVMMVTMLLLSPRMVHAQCTSDQDARLTFLETRLEDGQKWNKIWWGSWLAIFSIGVVSGITQGIIKDDQSNQADQFITAGKSALGIIDLTVRPHVSRHGADRIRQMPKSTPEQCAERLRFAEDTMKQAAKEASIRWDWKRHLWSFTLNLAHGLVIAEAWHDEGTGWKSFGISEASAEAHLWSHPTRARYDLREYEKDYGSLDGRESQLSFAPYPGGVSVVWRF